MRPFPYTLDAEKIPTAKNLDITPCAGSEVHVKYACPDSCWTLHLEAWRKEYRTGNAKAPQPMPEGHCMFEDPVGYGMIPYGCTDVATIRAAHESHIRGQLEDWHRDTPPAQFEKIVKAHVEATMAGHDLGSLPYIACLYASI